MQAEDFDGAWQINPRWDRLATMCLGQRHVTSKAYKTTRESSERFSFRGPETTAVWVRAIGRERKRTADERGRQAAGASRMPKVLGPPNWQLAGTVDLPPGETEIVVRGEGPGRKECDAVLISPSVTTLAGVEEFCALARRLRQTPSHCQLAAVFDDGRRIEGNLVSGWRGSGVPIARDGPGHRPGCNACCLDCLAADSPRQSDALLEFHNGDRMRGTICGYVAASTQSGSPSPPRCW